MARFSPSTTRPSVDAESHHLLLYDGVCGFCNRSVRWVLDHDQADRFRFAALQSPLATDVLRPYGRDASRLDTMFVLADWRTPRERLLQRSRAALFVASEVGGVARLLRPLAVLPTPLLDLGYRAVAALRYRLFGRRDVCALPSPDERHRFVDVAEQTPSP